MFLRDCYYNSRYVRGFYLALVQLTSLGLLDPGLCCVFLSWPAQNSEVKRARPRFPLQGLESHGSARAVSSSGSSEPDSEMPFSNGVEPRK